MLRLTSIEWFVNKRKCSVPLTARRLFVCLPVRHALSFILVGLLYMSCATPPSTVPAQYAEADAEAPLYPDYRDIVIPPNIAPLNVIVRDSLATAFVLEMRGETGEPLIAGATDDGKVEFDSTAWRALLKAHTGQTLTVSVYALRATGWVRYRPHTLTVATEPIDAFLSYRLIEPGYELYRQLGLYQRDLTTFSEEPIYENNRTYEEDDNHCINCHNYQNYGTERMLLHVRANHGGTILAHDGQCERIEIKDSAILAAGVYPSWHPTLPLIAFSTNKTGQTFHMYHREKIEVLDQASDLLLYDVEKNEVSHILKSRDQLETFPCWAPSGRRLYYCSAETHLDPAIPDSMREAYIAGQYDSLRYNILYLDFDPTTHRFSPPRLLHDFAAEGRSAAFPRVSPDGRYLLYALAPYGQFHIWHRESDLYVTDLQTDSTYALTEANSPDVDSYHTWSSNGRWIVFSSRRQDGNYTRPHIAYFDAHGHAHKAFALPQEDPEHDLLLLKSYNVPELTRDRVRTTPERLRRCIYGTETKHAQYRGPKADAHTSASPKKQ